jgi:hypothetical protein
MHLPPGLQKPHHIAELILPLLALVAVAWASIAACIHIVQTTAL